MTEFSRADVEILDESIAWDGFWKLRVLRLRHRLFAGGWSAPLEREMHCRGEAVGVLLYDPQLDAIGIVEQFRVGAVSRPGSPWLLELVAGLMEPGETPEQVAVRETLEESGCTVRELRLISEYFSSPGGSDEYFHLFCARVELGEVRHLHGAPGENEDIRLHVFSVEEAIEMQRRGRFNNAHTLIALQWLAAQRAEVRRAWS